MIHIDAKWVSYARMYLQRLWRPRPYSMSKSKSMSHSSNMIIVADLPSRQCQQLMHGARRM